MILAVCVYLVNGEVGVGGEGELYPLPPHI